MTDKNNKVCINDAIVKQNKRMLSNVPNVKQYSKEVLDAALREIQSGNFYSDGIYRLLLQSISANSKLDEYGKMIGDINGNPILNDISKADGYRKLEEELLGLRDRIKENYITITKTNNSITEKLGSIELSNKYGQPLISLRNQVDKMKQEAMEMMSTIRAYSEDGILTVNEKVEISKIWDKLKSEKEALIKQAMDNGVPTDDYKAKFNELKSLMNSIDLEVLNNSPIDATLINGTFDRYFDARKKLLLGVYDSLKATFDMLVSNVQDSLRDNKDSVTRGFTARERATKFRDEFDRLTNDNRLNPYEKKILRDEYYLPLLRSIPEDIELGKKYGIETDRLTEEFDRLTNIVAKMDLFEHMEETTDYAGTDLLEFKDGYIRTTNEEIDFFNKVLERNREAIDNFEGDFETHSLKVDKTDKSFTVEAEHVSVIGNKAILNSAKSKIEADRMVDSVETITSIRDIDVALEKLNKIAENLYNKTAAVPGDVSTKSGNRIDGHDGSKVSEYIKFSPNTYGTLSVWDNTLGFNKAKIVWYDANKNFLGSAEKESTEESFSLTAESPKGTAFVRISTQNSDDVRIKFESGSKPTPFNLSDTDVLNSVTDSKKQIADRQSDLDKYTAKNNSFAKDDPISELKNRLVLANMTPELKTEIKGLGNILNDHHKYMVRTLGEFGTDTEAMEKEYDKIKRFIDVLTENPSFEVIKPNNILNDLNRYSRELEENSKRVYNYYDKLIKDAKDDLEKSLSSEVDTENIKNNLLDKVDNYSKMISALKKLKANEKDFATDSIDKISNVILPEGDEKLTGLDKIILNDLFERIKAEQNWHENQADKFSIGKAEYVRRKEELIELLQPMLTSDLLDDTTIADRDEILRLFNDYYEAKERLTDNIIKAAESDLVNIHKDLSNALTLHKIRSSKDREDREEIRKSNERTKLIEDRIRDLQSNVPYKISLVSTHGDKFRNSNIRTRLICRVYKGSEEITDLIKDEHFRWTKRDSSGIEDIEWGRLHEGVGNEIDVTHEDVSGKATFNVEVFQEVGS